MISIEYDLNLQEAFYRLQKQKEVIALIVDGSGRKLGVLRLRDIIRHITSD